MLRGRVPSEPARFYSLGVDHAKPRAEVCTDGSRERWRQHSGKPREIQGHGLSIHYSTDGDELSALLALVQSEEPLEERAELAEHPLLLLTVTAFR